MKNSFSFALFFFVTSMLFLLLPKASYATTARDSAKLSHVAITTDDTRVTKLRAYLRTYDSPLAGSAEVFIAEADKNNLDWKLVVSISGVESWYGQRIPMNSYNGWGFGVYGNNVRRFSSWKDGIATVSKAIREEYMNKRGAKTLSEIGATYAADPKWTAKVTFFMNQIQNFKAEKDPTLLSISL